jgi:hypothetical protein
MCLHRRISELAKCNADKQGISGEIRSNASAHEAIDAGRGAPEATDATDATEVARRADNIWGRYDQKILTAGSI